MTEKQTLIGEGANLISNDYDFHDENDPPSSSPKRESIRVALPEDRFLVHLLTMTKKIWAPLPQDDSFVIGEGKIDVYWFLNIVLIFLCFMLIAESISCPSELPKFNCTY